VSRQIASSVLKKAIWIDALLVSRNLSKSRQTNSQQFFPAIKIALEATSPKLGEEDIQSLC
jgi:hypothetical protein